MRKRRRRFRWRSIWESSWAEKFMLGGRSLRVQRLKLRKELEMEDPQELSSPSFLEDVGEVLPLRGESFEMTSLIPVKTRDLFLLRSFGLVPLLFMFRCSPFVV